MKALHWCLPLFFVAAAAFGQAPQSKSAHVKQGDLTPDEAWNFFNLPPTE